jgi:hypothetical protein
MNANFFAIVKQIVTGQGEGILSEPRRLSAFFADLARDIPKPQKNAFTKCLEYDSAQILKNAAEPDRETCKQRLAQKLHEEEGLDLVLCAETLNLLAAVLFGEGQPSGEGQKKTYCKNCGKELQEGWKTCLYCSAQAAGLVIAPVISSGSGSAGHNVSSPSGLWIIRTFEGHLDYVMSVAFSPDGRYIVSGSGDTTLKLWEIESGGLIHSFEWHRGFVISVAFSPDGKYIVSGLSGGILKLWGLYDDEN